MIVRVKGSHEFFREFCQYIRITGKERMLKASSEKEVNDAAFEVYDEMMNILSFNFSFPSSLVPKEDFDVFPDCDLEEEIFEEAMEDFGEDENMITIFRLERAVDQLAEDILGRLACERLTELKENEIAS